MTENEVVVVIKTTAIADEVVTDRKVPESVVANVVVGIVVEVVKGSGKTIRTGTRGEVLRNEGVTAVEVQIKTDVGKRSGVEAVVETKNRRRKNTKVTRRIEIMAEITVAINIGKIPDKSLISSQLFTHYELSSYTPQQFFLTNVVHSFISKLCI